MSTEQIDLRAVVDRLEALDADQDHVGGECFIADYLQRAGCQRLNPDATVYGLTLHQTMKLLKDWGCPAFDPAQTPRGLNTPNVLPPVRCPLLIATPDPLGRLRAAERTSHLTDKNGQMEYELADGRKIKGRFSWTYP